MLTAKTQTHIMVNVPLYSKNIYQILFLFYILISQITVDPHYLKVQGTLRYTSRYPNLDISDLQNNRTTAFQKWICNLTPEVKKYIENIVEKWRNCSLGAISPLFHNILLPVINFYVKTGTRFSLRDKWLFEISEVAITRIDCTCWMPNSVDPDQTSFRSSLI